MTETATSTTRWDTLERQSSTAYVVSGGDPPGWTSPVVGIAMSVLLLAISYRLGTEHEPTARNEYPR